MKQLVLSLVSVVFISCQTVGVIESNDPKLKIRDGYSLLQAGRSIPALRLFSEAYDILKEQENESLKAEALVALGDVYKFKDSKAQTEKVYNFNASVTSYKDAEKILKKLNYNQRLSMVYWGIAQAYSQEKNVDKSCEYINKAAKAYYQPSGGSEDKLNENYIASVLPFFEHSKKQGYKATCGKPTH